MTAPVRRDVRRMAAARAVVTRLARRRRRPASARRPARGRRASSGRLLGRHRPSSGTTSSSRAAPTGPCRTSPRSSGCRRTPERLEVAYAIALRRRKGTPAALEDFAEVVTGWPTRVIEGWQIDAVGAAAATSAAAAHRLARPARRRAPPGRDAVRARPAELSRPAARVAAAPRRPSSGRGSVRDATTGSRRPRSGSGRFALHPLGRRGAALPRSPGRCGSRATPRTSGHPARLAAPATSSTLPIRATLPRASRRSPARAGRATAPIWTLAADAPARRRHRPRARPCSS